MTYPFLKGHGTENDFVLLPDPDLHLHGELPASRVAALCDRRAGLGGDGVLRVVRARYVDQPGTGAEQAEWFMDYRNADGSVAEMCGNGIRVFARHLVTEGLADASAPLPVATRDGLKTITFAGGAADGEISVDMGVPRLMGDTTVAVGETSWGAVGVDMGNPHAVAFVESVDAGGPVGPLLAEPTFDRSFYPAGVNVEFVEDVAPGHVRMRVHERGSGETRSCGTGACAVAVASALRDGRAEGEAVTRVVDLPGGTLTVDWTAEGRIVMTGPAVLVARGETDL
ncbi:diaminopimelate epimerase [Nocardioides bruguierae]|uniref:Diaminopimelate epimerase n=1 Tax=Nocardioides bruguierae TaxID=2945102 RepID=A0A9X2D6P4_9ACTN|nr:diaminopimelate epimerase [Nocardioides bruguierae]MCM0620178.1 diaminopimelate epimerase [Nocardioides bruguierae]